jgi:hypothetical protein
MAIWRRYVYFFEQIKCGQESRQTNLVHNMTIINNFYDISTSKKFSWRSPNKILAPVMNYVLGIFELFRKSTSQLELAASVTV